MIWFKTQVSLFFVLCLNEGYGDPELLPDGLQRISEGSRAMENKNTGCEKNPSDDAEVKKADKKNLPKVCSKGFVPQEARDEQFKPLPFEIHFNPYYENKKVAVEIVISEKDDGRNLKYFFVKVMGDHFGRFSEALWQKEYCCQDGTVRIIIQPNVRKEYFIFGKSVAKALWAYEIDKKQIEPEFVQFKYIAISDDGDYWSKESKKISINEKEE